MSGKSLFQRPPENRTRIGQCLNLLRFAALRNSQQQIATNPALQRTLSFGSIIMFRNATMGTTMNKRSSFSKLCHSPILRRFILTLAALAWSGIAFCGEIHNAAASGDLETIKALLRGNPDLVSSKETNGYHVGYTPLHYAAADDHAETAEFLLLRGADVDAKDKSGMTPLLLSVCDSNLKVAEILLANKADVNATNGLGMTPLHYAAYRGDKDMTVLLLANRADINAKDYAGKTPLQWAIDYFKTDEAQLLRQHGASGQAIATNLAAGPVANESTGDGDASRTQSLPPLDATLSSKSNELNGAVCGIDKTTLTIKVIPWDKQKETWDEQGIRAFKLTPETTIYGETKATVAELADGKAEIKSFHLTGIGQSGVTGTPFEIKDISQILYRRVTVMWTSGAKMPEATTIELPYLFGGESMPGYIGSGGSFGSQIGSDDVIVGSDAK
jgi:ankyrin repeat protein